MERLSSRAPQPSPPAIELLIVSRDAAQCARLRQIAAESAWIFRQAVSAEEAARALAGAASTVVILDRDLPDEDWHLALPRLAGLRQAAGVLLASRVADEYLWLEVSRCQGHDVLRKPFDRGEAIRAVTSAWSWRRLTPRR